jgi:dTDP-glucose 4,6-dehydratase
VYGPGQQLYRIIPRTIFCILTGEKLSLHGGGHSVRSFIHIRDVAEGTLRVARSAKPGEAFHFSTPENISIRSLVERICELLGAKFSEVVEIVDDRPGKDSAYLLDSAKARKLLDWTDAVSLDQGLNETIAWVKTNLASLKQQPQKYIHKR